MRNRYIPYGYKIQEGTYAIALKEANAVKEIFVLYAARCSYKEIAERMNKSELPSYGLAGWNKNQVARILSNEKYIGGNGYPAIISEDLFASVRSIHSDKLAKWTPADNDPSKVLWKRLVCPKCGKRLLRKGSPAISKGIVLLRCESTKCKYSLDIQQDTLINSIMTLLRQTADELKSAQNGKGNYTLTEDIIRISNKINRHIEKPTDPDEAIELILQGIAARYRGLDPSLHDLPDILLNMDDDRPSETNWKVFRGAVSYISPHKKRMCVGFITGAERECAWS